MASVEEARAPYYLRDLPLIQHRGFVHADACVPGILELLDPVREGSGLVGVSMLAQAQNGGSRGAWLAIAVVVVLGATILFVIGRRGGR